MLRLSISRAADARGMPKADLPHNHRKTRRLDDNYIGRSRRRQACQRIDENRARQRNDGRPGRNPLKTSRQPFGVEPAFVCCVLTATQLSPITIAAATPFPALAAPGADPGVFALQLDGLSQDQAEPDTSLSAQALAQHGTNSGRNIESAGAFLRPGFDVPLRTASQRESTPRDLTSAPTSDEASGGPDLPKIR